MTDLKTLLFEKCDAATGAILSTENVPGSQLGELKRRTFCTLYGLISEAGLDDEYFKWKVAQVADLRAATCDAARKGGEKNGSNC